MTTVIDSPNSSPDVGASQRARRRDANVARRSLSSRIYWPALSIVAMAVVLIAIGVASHWGGTSFAASITDQRVVVVGPVTIGILCALPGGRATATGTAPAVLRPRLSTRPPLHGLERDARRAPRRGALAVVRRGGAKVAAVDRGAALRVLAAMARHRPDLHR